MKSLKVNMKCLWRILAKKWDEAGEIQCRIDEAKLRNQELYHRGHVRTWL